jgi:hypothetical protein
VLRKISFAFATLVLLLTISTAAFAQKATVTRVLTVKTDNAAAYVQVLESGKELMKKLGVTPILRVHQAVYAGPDAGAIVVAIEWPSMVVMAEGDAKLRADKECGAWLKSLDKIRTIVSDSLYREL